MFKKYYDYQFNSDEFNNDFDSIFSSEVSEWENQEPTEMQKWFNTTLNEFEDFKSDLLAFEFFFKKKLQHFEWDPKKDFYIEKSQENNELRELPNIRIYTKKQAKKLKANTLCKIKFKDSLVYHDTKDNKYYTDYCLKIQ